jgi:ADP-heptose:LPS heptosyltransferase
MKLKLKLLIDYYVGGAIHVLLKPVVFTLGKILRRNHRLEALDEVTFIKMLGGGSLVIAYPSLLALKQKLPHLRLNLMTTQAVKPFADLLAIFDEIIVIRDENFLHLAIDSLRAIVRLWRAKALVDLEIHSRLSSLFTLLTCAFNRIGFYTDVSYWRTSLYTHLLFYNKFAPVHLIYDQVTELLGGQPGHFPSAKAEFLKNINKRAVPPLSTDRAWVGVAPGCSDLGRERMLTAEQWSTVLEKRCSLQDNLGLVFIGGPRDTIMAQGIISRLQPRFLQAKFLDACGQHNLGDSVALMRQLDTFYCIDSGLLHYARMLDLKTISFWGPTDPASRLRPQDNARDEIHYLRLSCSPCVHIAADAPCQGNNICMAASVEPEKFHGRSNPAWLAQ